MPMLPLNDKLAVARRELMTVISYEPAPTARRLAARAEEGAAVPLSLVTAGAGGYRRRWCRRREPHGAAGSGTPSHGGLGVARTAVLEARTPSVWFRTLRRTPPRRSFGQGGSLYGGFATPPSNASYSQRQRHTSPSRKALNRDKF